MIGEIEYLSGDIRASGRIIVALDGSRKTCVDLIERICDEPFPPTLFFKLGMQSVVSGNFWFLHKLLLKKEHDLGPDRPISIFWDLKLNDTANTVREACRALVGVELVTVSGGLSVIQAAMDGVRNSFLGSSEKYRPKVLAVPYLTDHDMTHEHSWVAVCNSALLEADGIVCRADHIPFLWRKETQHKIFVCPGIRETDASPTDGHRVVTKTPEQAMQTAADFLVVGRPILNDPDPLDAAYRFAHAAARGLGEEVNPAWTRTRR